MEVVTGPGEQLEAGAAEHVRDILPGGNLVADPGQQPEERGTGVRGLCTVSYEDYLNPLEIARIFGRTEDLIAAPCVNCR